MRYQTTCDWQLLYLSSFQWHCSNSLVYIKTEVSFMKRIQDTSSSLPSFPSPSLPYSLFLLLLLLFFFSFFLLLLPSSFSLSFLFLVLLPLLFPFLPFLSLDLLRFLKLSFKKQKIRFLKEYYFISKHLLEHVD